MKIKQILVFGEDWGGLPSSTQYLISELLSSGWQIIWINSIGMREPGFKWKDFRRIWNKIYSFFILCYMYISHAVRKYN